MSKSRCEECGGYSPSAPLSGRPIVHKPGCSIGLARQKRTAITALVKAAESREIAERELERRRTTVTGRAKACAELGISKAEIARAAKVERSYIYKILPTG